MIPCLVDLPSLSNPTLVRRYRYVGTLFLPALLAQEDGVEILGRLHPRHVFFSFMVVAHTPPGHAAPKALHAPPMDVCLDVWVVCRKDHKTGTPEDMIETWRHQTAPFRRDDLRRPTLPGLDS